jgi:hypothetical protein
MIELLQPDLLFNKQKVFTIQDSVNTTISNVEPKKAVVVFDLVSETMPQPIKDMLDKLIQACQFKPDETIYLNARFAGDVTLGHLQNTYNPKTVLVFGDTEVSRNVTKLKKNFPYDLNGIKLLNAESLEMLVKNDAAKKTLWGVLKKMLQL